MKNEVFQHRRKNWKRSNALGFVREIHYIFFNVQCTLNISGEDECEVPPVPIPNTEVKLDIADDSWGSPPVKIGFRQIFYIPP